MTSVQVNGATRSCGSQLPLRQTQRPRSQASSRKLRTRSTAATVTTTVRAGGATVANDGVRAEQEWVASHPAS